MISTIKTVPTILAQYWHNNHQWFGIRQPIHPDPSPSRTKQSIPVCSPYTPAAGYSSPSSISATSRRTCASRSATGMLRPQKGHEPTADSPGASGDGRPAAPSFLTVPQGRSAAAGVERTPTPEPSVAGGACSALGGPVGRSAPAPEAPQDCWDGRGFEMPGPKLAPERTSPALKVGAGAGVKGFRGCAAGGGYAGGCGYAWECGFPAVPQRWLRGVSWRGRVGAASLEVACCHVWSLGAVLHETAAGPCAAFAL